MLRQLTSGALFKSRSLSPMVSVTGYNVSKRNLPRLQVENEMEEQGSQRGQSLVSASWARVFSSFMVSSSVEKPVTTTWITELPFLT